MKFGTRFFIPKKLIPGAYEYNRKISTLPDIISRDPCPICLCDLNEDPMADPEAEGELLPKKMTHFYQTPCKHNFHKNCLVVWISQNNECPICRHRLPPY